MKDVFISIAIPIVKDKFLHKTIQSALNQQYENFEIILLNNAKTVSQKEIIKEICLSYKDNRINYFENDFQLPPIKNWNSIINLSKGVLFAILSDDDYYDLNFLSEINKLYLKYPDTEIFRCRSRIVNELNETIDYTSIFPEQETIVDFIWHRLSGYRKQFLSEFIVRREALIEIGGFVSFENAWCSDDATWIKMVDRKGMVISTNKILCNYRYSTQSITSLANSKSKLIAINQYTLWFNMFYKINYSKFHQNNEKFMVDQIPILFLNRISKMKRDALSSSDSSINLLKNWIQNKEKCSLTYSDMIYSLIKYNYNKYFLKKI